MIPATCYNEYGNNRDYEKGLPHYPLLGLFAHFHYTPEMAKVIVPMKKYWHSAYPRKYHRNPHEIRRKAFSRGVENAII
jgi:hypothetical protein